MTSEEDAREFLKFKPDDPSCQRLEEDLIKLLYRAENRGLEKAAALVEAESDEIMEIGESAHKQDDYDRYEQCEAEAVWLNTIAKSIRDLWRK